MRVLALASLFFVALTGAGCLKADFQDGQVLCSGTPGRECPSGYFCAPNNFCYHNGDTVPPTRDLSFVYHYPDFAVATYDLGAPADLNMSLPMPDLQAPPDLSQHD